MKSLFSLSCACCGSEITAPQWYKGKPYGWTCITKVSGQKRKKSKAEYIPVSLDTFEGKVVVSYNDKELTRLNFASAYRLVKCGDADTLHREIYKLVKKSGFLQIKDARGNNVFKPSFYEKLGAN